MSATQPSTTAACASDAEILNVLLGAPDSHNFCMQMADGVGGVGRLSVIVGGRFWDHFHCTRRSTKQARLATQEPT